MAMREDPPVTRLRSRPPAGLDVRAIVEAVGAAEVLPSSRVLPSYGNLVMDGRVLCAAPLEHIVAEAYRYRGASLALHPDDISKLNGRAA